MALLSKISNRASWRIYRSLPVLFDSSRNLQSSASKQKAKSNTSSKQAILLGTACVATLAGCGFAAWKVIEKEKEEADLPEDLTQFEKFKMPHTNNLILYKRNGHWIPYDFIGNDKQLERVKNFEVRPSDTFVISFPKSGTTWVQEIVNNITHIHNPPPAIRQKQDEKMRIDERFPYLEFAYPGLKTINQRRDPRLIKSHLQLDALPKELLEGKGKIIYVARNVKDVTVSMYHFYKIISSVRYEGSFGEFRQTFDAGLVAYGPYCKHVSEYWTHRNELSNMLFVTYEDIQKDPVGEIIKIANFLERPVTREQAENIAEVSTFDNMKINPKTNYNWFKSYGILDRNGDFMRKGTVGDWVNYYSEEEQKNTDKLVREHFDPIGLKFKDKL